MREDDCPQVTQAHNLLSWKSSRCSHSKRPYCYPAVRLKSVRWSHSVFISLGVFREQKLPREKRAKWHQKRTPIEIGWGLLSSRMNLKWKVRNLAQFKGRGSRYRASLSFTGFFGILHQKYRRRKENPFSISIPHPRKAFQQPVVCVFVRAHLYITSMLMHIPFQLSFYDFLINLLAPPLHTVPLL